MRFAIHTISWAGKELVEILTDVKKAGYDGVELFEHPDEPENSTKVESIFKLFNHDFGLHLTGICSGAFEQRCAFVRIYSRFLGVHPSDKSAPYVYADEWRENDSAFYQAMHDGLKIAIHPHMYKPIQTLREAESLLTKYPGLRFMPDTAHLSIAGDDPVEAIKKRFAMQSPRIDAIHLKDWREYVGRSFQFYAYGFCELGEGDIDLPTVLEVIKQAERESKFDGWLIVEQDTTSNPLESARKSLRWLRQRLLP